LVHDNLSGFVANEHIDHATVQVLAGEGLGGGGNIVASRTLSLDVNSLTADASPDGAADYVLTYDTSAGGHKKVLLNDLPIGAGGEINTASNVGTGGVGVFKQKSGTTIELKNINSTSSESGIAIVDDTGNNEVDINLSINSLTADASPDGAADYVLTYDTSASVHKKVLLNNLPSSGSGLAYQEISATTETSTTSMNYIQLDSMTVTPASGTYSVSFSSSGSQSQQNQDAVYAIYVDGVIVQRSRRLMKPMSGPAAAFDVTLHTQAVVTVNGSQAIEIRYMVNGGTFNVHERNMILLKVA
jgi:hypothetical protein